MIKTHLLHEFHITPDTYRRKLDNLKKDPEESWVKLACRVEQLLMKWMAECETKKDVRNLMGMETIIISSYAYLFVRKGT